ncbi:hypothetical protein MVEN_00327000 [Mycena venus]|uniref:DUF6535 domain-containing protein n=1 Tax=Mycena venus TaxID=2733690 RepID=A0A8H6YVF1_9AGAR|nr:hypothetical protein MVEN_00327000 [Mycena venus]
MAFIRSDKEYAEKIVDPSEEAAAAKLWALYVSEAAKYDKALVESWKSDMEGMLIFAGLFSASLTAFIIESYKTLRPDSGDSTVQLLTQISLQLAAAANGSSTFHAPAPTPFRPPTTSLVCNALWFISLGLSLTCALIATLLEQWARDFLYRAEMRSAPVIRARIFSYLYYGLKRFNMHTVVDIIPLLLHTSLLFFYAGLITFLLPINLGIAALVASLLLIVVATYSLLTLLPLWHSDCPYRTPLSGIFWRVSTNLRALWRRRRQETTPENSDSLHSSSSTETLVEVISDRAMAVSDARSARDYRALVWTVKSLADDVELEPFVAAIPDILWGPRFRRHSYDEHIQSLMRNPNLKLLSRIQDLLRSCESGLLLPEASSRRRVACYKALWAIASIQGRPAPSNYQEALDFSALCSYLNSDLWAYISGQTKAIRGGSATRRALLRLIDDFCAHTPHRILFRALAQAATLQSPPYQWTHTTKLIQLDPSPSYSALRDDLERALWSVAGHNHNPSFIGSKTHHWVDTVVRELYSWWREDRTGDGPPVPVPRSIIHYLNSREADEAVMLLLSGGSFISLLSAFPITVSRGPYSPWPIVSSAEVCDEVLASLWRVASLVGGHNLPIELCETILDAVSTAASGSSSIALSVTALIKGLVFDSLSHPRSGSDAESALEHWLLPTETAVVLANSDPDPEVRSDQEPPNIQLLHDRIVEARVALLADFLDTCHSPDSDSLPFKAIETLANINTSVPRAQIHAAHQVRFARALHRVVQSASGTVCQWCGGFNSRRGVTRCTRKWEHIPGVCESSRWFRFERKTASCLVGRFDRAESGQTDFVRFSGG